MRYRRFWNLQEAAVGPGIEEAAVTPIAHSSNNILMVLESPGGCCEAIRDGLEPSGNCGGTIRTLFQWNIYGLEFPGGCCEGICAVLQ